MKIEEIKDKDRSMFGNIHKGSILKGHKAEIEPKVSIRIYGQEWNRIDSPVDFDQTFKIGDWAEYDSYNLIYDGEIVAIGEKTISIMAYPNSQSAELHRLNIYEFSDRNWNYSRKRIAEHNSEEMMYI